MIKKDVLKKMVTLIVSHRTKEASELQRDISNKIRKLMDTKNKILLFSFSASFSAFGLIEGKIRCRSFKTC